MSFIHAIVRPPGKNFAGGLTSAQLGAPEADLAKQQHADYVRALAECGVAVTVLAEADDFPDATFVEDVAIVTPKRALLTRPGAASRRGEVDLMRPALQKHFPTLAEIQAPGTVDGGDVCEAGGHWFIGLSARTNEDGAGQLAQWLKSLGFRATLVDIHAHSGLLHLKSGLAWLGGNKLAVVEALAKEPAWRDYECIRVAESEDYAANCLLINETLLMARGFPQFAAEMRGQGMRVRELDMSEFRKMDGGLSCLSLRW